MKPNRHRPGAQRFWGARLTLALGLAGLAGLAGPAGPAAASLTATPTAWSNFANNPGYIADYTALGQPIVDHEQSQDPTNGGTGVGADPTDLASGSPTSDPGVYNTPAYGYYNGGTLYDPLDPSTLNDDFILFRMRLEGDPQQGGAGATDFQASHWNILVDVDSDGYKEYWVDLQGGFNGPGYDRVQILYNNDNTQAIADADAPGVRVDQFRAYDDGRGGANGSFTRLLTVPEMNTSKSDYIIEIQVPLAAFKDSLGNQVVFPTSPIAFVFSTSESGPNPLQKDWMNDLNGPVANGSLVLTDPIIFGDVVKLDGDPDVFFANGALQPVQFYTVDSPQGDQVYACIRDRAANTSPSTLQTVAITVSDPGTGDDEPLQLYETGVNTGIFCNNGGATPPVNSDPTRAWISGVQTNGSAANTTAQTWFVRYNGTVWTVYKCTLGATAYSDPSCSAQATNPVAGVAYTPPGGEATFTLYANSPLNGNQVSFDTAPADPLFAVPSDGVPDNSDGALSLGAPGYIETVSGNTVEFSYTNFASNTFTASAAIIGAGEPFIQFTRSNGLPSANFEIKPDPNVSDRLFVTVSHPASNQNASTIETISVTLRNSFGELETLTLTETGANTGVFRNTTGLRTQVLAGAATQGDALWEDVDGGTVTATFTYSGTDYAASASLFYTDAGGRVSFTDAAGVTDIVRYAPGAGVFVRVADENLAACGGATTYVDVTVNSDVGDSEPLRLYETAAGSAIFINRKNDLTTTAGSATVVSASSDFVAEGVVAGDTFVIANGPDAGTYHVASRVDATTLILTTGLTASRTGIGFNATPLLTAAFDGAFAAGDGTLEAVHADTITVTYLDCDDGDPNGTNNVKTDVADFNAPPLVINEVLFYAANDAALICPGDPRCATAESQYEYFQIYNSSTAAQTLTGYSVRDEDGFAYTFPTLTLASGERVYVFLVPATGNGEAYNGAYGTGVYFFFKEVALDAGGTVDVLGDPADADPSDQLTLYGADGTVIDFVAWSATSNTTLDFRSDDTAAVADAIWQNDAYRNVSASAPEGLIDLGEVLRRSSDGFDTNQPADWVYSGTNVFASLLATPVFVSGFQAFAGPDGVQLEWETAYEQGAVGFHLYRRRGAGDKYDRVTERLLPALLAHPQGGRYRFLDRDADPSAELAYRIEELTAGGRRHSYGPFIVRPAAARVATPVQRDFSRTPRQPSRAARQRAAAARRAAVFSAVDTVPATGKPDALRILVRDNGLYHLSARQIAERLQLDVKLVRALILKTRFKLSAQGRRVSYLPTRSGLYFYGEGGASLYSDLSVYWLRRGAGKSMAMSPGVLPPHLQSGQTFREDLHLEQDLLANPAFSRNPREDYWAWKELVGYPGLDAVELPVTAVDVAPGAAVASLTVQLATALLDGLPGSHSVEVFLNDGSIGTWYWQGRQTAAVFTFDQALLREGANTVKLVAATPDDYIFVDSLDLGYARRLRASGDVLLVRVSGGQVVTVRGFTDPEILLFDLRSPRDPRLVSAATVISGTGGHSLTFAPSGRDVPYLAVARRAARRPVAVLAAWDSSLRDPSTAADYLVLATPTMRAAAERLAARRAAQGLRTLVVDPQAVYDTFAHGVPDPEAFRRLLKYASRHWSAAPRYLVLAGAGSYDYRDRAGLGQNLLPPQLVATGEGLCASDVWLGDTDDDGLAEVAVGRLPVLTAAELDALVAKIAAAETAPATGDTVWMADDPDKAGDFPNDSERMIAHLPPGSIAERVNVGSLPLTTARARVFDGFARGVDFMSFIGHAGLFQLTDDPLLDDGDVPALAANTATPVLTAATCAVGRFDIPGIPSLSETLLLRADGGAAAVWAPSGYSFNRGAAVLGEEFYRAVYQGGARRLGDAVLSAAAEHRSRGGMSGLSLLYNILGDPALLLRVSP